MMSTPVNSLPSNGNPTTVPQLTQEQDALIQDVLNEMEKEMSSTVVRAEPAPISHPAPQIRYVQPTAPSVPVMQPQIVKPVKWNEKLWNMEKFQLALAAAVIAYLLLQPTVSDLIFDKIVALEPFRQYDWILRIALLVTVLYFSMLYLKL